MTILTQIIGKTSAIKGGLFRIKERLQLLGIKVQHPIEDRIYITPDNQAFTYNPKQWSSYEILLDFSESVRDSDVHIVSNDIGGIVGRETTLSIVLAMAYGKPIIITHKPYFRPNVNKQWIKIIERNKKELNMQNLLRLKNDDLKPYVELVATQRPRYNLTPQEKTAIKRAVRSVLQQVLALQ